MAFWDSESRAAAKTRLGLSSKLNPLNVGASSEYLHSLADAKDKVYDAKLDAYGRSYAAKHNAHAQAWENYYNGHGPKPPTFRGTGSAILSAPFQAVGKTLKWGAILGAVGVGAAALASMAGSKKGTKSAIREGLEGRNETAANTVSAPLAGSPDGLPLEPLETLLVPQQVDPALDAPPANPNDMVAAPSGKNYASALPANRLPGMKTQQYNAEPGFAPGIAG